MFRHTCQLPCLLRAAGAISTQNTNILRTNVQASQYYCKKRGFTQGYSGKILKKVLKRRKLKKS